LFIEPIVEHHTSALRFAPACHGFPLQVFPWQVFFLARVAHGSHRFFLPHDLVTPFAVLAQSFLESFTAMHPRPARSVVSCLGETPQS
jgi:hypothetical protein